MFQKVLTALSGLLTGLILGFVISIFIWPSSEESQFTFQHLNPLAPQKQVIGFLPFWLLDKATGNYSKELSTLTYFSLTLDNDGTILRQTNPGESEPGWLTLKNGKPQPFFDTATKNNIPLSVAIFAGKESTITSLAKNPTTDARNLITEVTPIMQKYNFKDLNLDVESVVEATDSAQVANFSQFVKSVKSGLDQNHLGTLTLEVSPSVFVRKNIIDPTQISQYVDHLVVMAYDYHFIGSYVTGPVAPLGGAGTVAEFDTQAGIDLALKTIPASKIVLGIPVYGYEWETLGSAPRSAVIPSTGVTASNARVEELVKNCSICQFNIDNDAKEKYITYKDPQTNTYHQIFYPDITATQAKIDFANQKNLGGIAIWALGYDGPTILDPLKSYL